LVAGADEILADPDVPRLVELGQRGIVERLDVGEILRGVLRGRIGRVVGVGGARDVERGVVGRRVGDVVVPEIELGDDARLGLDVDERVARQIEAQRGGGQGRVGDEERGALVGLHGADRLGEAAPVDLPPTRLEVGDVLAAARALEDEAGAVGLGQVGKRAQAGERLQQGAGEDDAGQPRGAAVLLGELRDLATGEQHEREEERGDEIEMGPGTASQSSRA
jgi:hypothetical protein